MGVCGGAADTGIGQLQPFDLLGDTVQGLPVGLVIPQLISRLPLPVHSQPSVFSPFHTGSHFVVPIMQTFPHTLQGSPPAITK